MMYEIKMKMKVIKMKLKQMKNIN